MVTRVNVNIPEALFDKGHELVKKGYFSNFSELVREGLRKEIADYEVRLAGLSDEEKKLFALLKKADENGLLVSEKELKKHGLDV